MKISHYLDKNVGDSAVETPGPHLHLSKCPLRYL